MGQGKKLVFIKCPDFPGGAVVKNLHANAEDARDAGSVPEMAGKCPLRGKVGLGGKRLGSYQCLWL